MFLLKGALRNTHPTLYLTLARENGKLLARFPRRCLSRLSISEDNLSPPPVSSKELTDYEKQMSKYDELFLKSLQGGGPKGIERHVQKNKKILVRDRINRIIDPGSKFFEIGALAGFDMMYGDIPSAGLVIGIGKILNVYCMIGGNDATVKAGTYFPIGLHKSLRTQEIAEINRLPSIYIPDSGGAYLPLQSQIFLNGGKSFFNQAVMSSLGLPQIALVAGSCTAGAAYNPTMSDEAIVINSISKIFLGGPPLVKAALGEVVSEEDLGGAWMHSSVSGCTDHFAKTEEEAFTMCREIIEVLNFNPSPPLSSTFTPPLTKINSWTNFAAKPHLEKEDLYTILSSILDGSNFKEFKTFYGIGLITGFGYIEGELIGIVANSDEILSPEAQKGAHFLDLCNRRNVPVLFLQNSVPIGSDIENSSIVLRDRSKLVGAIATLNVPKISLTLTSLRRDDNLIMCGPSCNPNLSFMWPSAYLSQFEMSEGEIEDDEKLIDALVAGGNMLTDRIFPPEETRNILSEAFKILKQQNYNKSVPHLSKSIIRM